jgi:hypothetical protein
MPARRVSRGRCHRGRSSAAPGTNHPDPCVPARSDCVDQQWREPLHPTEEPDVIDLDAPFGEELFEIAVTQPEAEIPADRKHDHPRAESKPHERRKCLDGRCGTTARLTAAPSSAMGVPSAKRSRPASGDYRATSSYGEPRLLVIMVSTVSANADRPSKLRVELLEVAELHACFELVEHTGA